MFESLAVLFFAILSGLLMLVAFYIFVKYENAKDAVVQAPEKNLELRLLSNKQMSLSIALARDNRRLAKKCNSFKAALTADFIRGWSDARLTTWKRENKIDDFSLEFGSQSETRGIAGMVRVMHETTKKKAII